MIRTSTLPAANVGRGKSTSFRPPYPLYGARYDKMMEAFGGKGFFIENPKDLKSALQEAMDFRGPALVNVRISQESPRKPQQFRWHS